MMAIITIKRSTDKTLIMNHVMILDQDERQNAKQQNHYLDKCLSDVV